MYEKYGFRPIFLIKVTCLFANSLAIQLKRELFSKTRAMALALASLRRERWLFGQYHLHLRTITHDCFIAIDAIQLIRESTVTLRDVALSTAAGAEISTTNRNE